jgi:glycine hydroxymethyltransferase
LVLGGPLPHVIAAKAVAFEEALLPDFKKYARQVVDNARVLAGALINEGIRVLTGGTDNHLVLIDVFSSFNLTGKAAETALREAGLTVNRNTIPQDKNGSWHTSGVRLGTPAVTTLGLRQEEMKSIARIIAAVLKNTRADKLKNRVEVEKGVLQKAQAEVRELLSRFLLYPELRIG